MLFFFRFVWFSGSSEFVRVEPAAGPDPSLAGTAQQGIASTAVGQGHGTEEGAGIVHGVESDTVGWQQLRQFAAVQTRTRGRTDGRRADIGFVLVSFAGQVGRHHRQTRSSLDVLSGPTGGRSGPLTTRFHSLGSRVGSDRNHYDHDHDRDHNFVIELRFYDQA